MFQAVNSQQGTEAAAGEKGEAGRWETWEKGGERGIFGSWSIRALLTRADGFVCWVLLRIFPGHLGTAMS